MVHFHVVALFPESIEPYLKSSIIGRAIGAKKIKISFYNPKDYPEPSRRATQLRSQDERVDRRPYGGGPGMVLRPEPILRAAQKALRQAQGKQVEKIFFSTDGKLFDEAMAKKFSKPGRSGKKDFLFICGHYEGVDARVQKILKAKKISVGPYVLTGGELPAAILIDAISRHVPGVLGKVESLEASRVSSPEVYTRPDMFVWKGKKYKVPEVLKSGHHAKIDEWKKKRRT